MLSVKLSVAFDSEKIVRAQECYCYVTRVILPVTDEYAALKIFLSVFKCSAKGTKLKLNKAIISKLELPQ